MDASGAGLLSMASPRTLKIRPSVTSPTGIVIGAPVLTASMPRTSPSVGPMAIHLTVSSPKCCATSTTNFVPSLRVISMASLISGNFPSGNLMSKTAPMIWVSLPTIFSAICVFLLINTEESNPCGFFTKSKPAYTFYYFTTVLQIPKRFR